ncbi:hypothetical protein ACOME3_006048 [Neoechinorhynchus agilis]
MSSHQCELSSESIDLSKVFAIINSDDEFDPIDCLNRMYRENQNYDKAEKITTDSLSLLEERFDELGSEFQKDAEIVKTNKEILLKIADRSISNLKKWKQSWHTLDKFLGETSSSLDRLLASVKTLDYCKSNVQSVKYALKVEFPQNDTNLYFFFVSDFDFYSFQRINDWSKQMDIFERLVDGGFNLSDLFGATEGLKEKSDYLRDLKIEGQDIRDERLNRIRAKVIDVFRNEYFLNANNFDQSVGDAVDELEIREELKEVIVDSLKVSNEMRNILQKTNDRDVIEQCLVLWKSIKNKFSKIFSLDDCFDIYCKSLNHFLDATDAHISTEAMLRGIYAIKVEPHSLEFESLAKNLIEKCSESLKDTNLKNLPTECLKDRSVKRSINTMSFLDFSRIKRLPPCVNGDPSNSHLLLEEACDKFVYKLRSLLASYEPKLFGLGASLIFESLVNTFQSFMCTLEPMITEDLKDHLSKNLGSLVSFNEKVVMLKAIGTLSVFQHDLIFKLRDYKTQYVSTKSLIPIEDIELQEFVVRLHTDSNDSIDYILPDVSCTLVDSISLSLEHVSNFVFQSAIQCLVFPIEHKISQTSPENAYTRKSILSQASLPSFTRLPSECVNAISQFVLSTPPNVHSIDENRNYNVLAALRLIKSFAEDDLSTIWIDEVVIRCNQLLFEWIDKCLSSHIMDGGRAQSIKDQLYIDLDYYQSVLDDVGSAESQDVKNFIRKAKSKNNDHEPINLPNDLMELALKIKNL